VSAVAPTIAYLPGPHVDEGLVVKDKQAPPLPVEYVPASHRVQSEVAVFPVARVVKPAGQFVQDPNPVVDLYVPILHAVQLAPVYPAAQTQSDDEVLPVEDVVLPTPQDVQDEVEAPPVE